MILKKYSQFFKKIRKNFYWIFSILIPVALFLFQQIPRFQYSHDVNNLWHNVFLTFFISDVTIISLFFGVLIPILIGSSKDKIPLAFLNVMKNKVFNKKMLFLISITLIIHSIQLIACHFKKDNEIFDIIFVVLTTIYFLIFFYYISVTIKTFNYSSYFNKQIESVFKMIKKDVLKKRLNKYRKNKYIRVIGFIFEGFPETNKQFEELETQKINLGLGLYYLAINLFSNGLFLFERFSFFKKIEPVIDIKYLKENDLSSSYEVNLSLEIMINKLTSFFAFFEKEHLITLFNGIRSNKNIILFGNLSNDGMSFLTTLHLKLSSFQIWEIDLTWIIFLTKFIQTSADFVKIKNEKQLWIRNKTSAKKYVIKNIFINPGLFVFFNQICNDKKILKKSFKKDTWKILHSYTALQSLFGIGKFSMENKFNIKQMLSLNIFKNNKFLFNNNIQWLIYEINDLSQYVNENEKLKSDNKLYWNEQLKNFLLSSELEIEKSDIENIQLIKNNEISDFLISVAPQKLLESDKLLKNDALPILTNKVHEYIFKNIQEEIEAIQLFNISKYQQLKLVPYRLINIFKQLLRAQIAFYDINSDHFKRASQIVLYFLKIRQNFFLYHDENNNLQDYVNNKFLLTKTRKNVFGFDQKSIWFNFSFLRNEDDLKKEKMEWQNQKK